MNEMYKNEKGTETMLGSVKGRTPGELAGWGGEEFVRRGRFTWMRQLTEKEEN